MYSGTYVPVVMNMTASSPEEQILYYYGAPFYVMPPQQYSVHPTGLNTFYNVLPGPTTPTNGMLYYNDQDVHNQTPFPMVPPLQQHPSTMRKRKTIVVRDPNQDHKDITKEIILEAGRSWNPTLPVGNDFSVPVPLQQLDQLVELERVYYVDRAQGPPAPADLKPDEQLESYSVPYAALDGAEKPTSSAEPVPAQAVTPTPDKTEPVQVPPEVPASVLFAETDTAPHPDDCQSLREDKPELAFQQSDFDLKPVSTTVENYSVSPVIVEHLASAETPADEIVEQEAEPPKNEPEPSSGDESNDGVLSPVEDPNDTMPGPAQAVTSKPDETEPVQVSPEVPASALIAINEPAETDTAPRPDDSQSLREDKPELAFQQSDFDLEPVSTTVENYSVSPVIVEHLASAETPAETPADEIVEQEAELLKIELEPSSEDESNDGVLSPVEDPINNTMHKPEMENKRIQYGREFLLRMQFMPDCMQKPKGLPFIPDVVLHKCNQNRLPPDPQRLISRDPFFIPAFADNRSMIPNEKRAPQPNAIWRQPPPSKSPLNVPMNEEVELKKAENAWKPRIKSSNSTEDLETQKTEKLFRTVRSILNKLTPEMFDQLMKQVKELHIDTEERLKGVVNLIFEKAIDEPNFSMGYGTMCKSLAAINVPMANKPHSNVNFQRLLLHCCQKEFEKDKTSNDVLDKKQRELEAAVSASEREQLQDELEEAKNKSRRKTKGNVKFIGELFKLRLLTESIIHNCVVKLLKKNDEESLECLSILLTTAGKEMDVKKAKVQMDKYFKKMEEIVKGAKTSSRVRFMLQDVIYLRLNNWVPRRVVEGPKTIESIHMDAKMEQQEEQRIVQEKLRSMGPTRPVFSSHKTINTVRMNSTLDPNKIPKIKKFPADDKIYFGPNFERRRLNWKNGCNGETSARATSGASVKLDAVPDLTTNKPELSEEEMEKRSKSIIEEFLHINDYKEALHCVEELDQGRMLYLFVQVGVETTLEQNQITRDHMGHLFHQLLQAGILSTSQFFKGFSETLEIADDMAIDIPYVWQYIAELVNPVLRKGGISLRELLIEFSKPLLPVARAGILSAEILHLLCKQMSQTEVGALWGDSKLSWADFLPETVDVNNFITEQKLQFTLSECSCSRSCSCQRKDSSSCYERWRKSQRTINTVRKRIL